jgi:hypothetical protein
MLFSIEIRPTYSIQDTIIREIGVLLVSSPWGLLGVFGVEALEDAAG